MCNNKTSVHFSVDCVHHGTSVHFKTTRPHTIFLFLEQAWSHLLSVNLEDFELHQFWEQGIRESLRNRVNQVGFPLLVIITEITCYALAHNLNEV